jgi:hypothetical protein
MSDGAFLGYVALLVVSGIALMALSVGGFGQSVLVRVLDAWFGLGFLGYSFYLLFIFEGGDVQIYYYAFVAPVLAFVKVFRAHRAQRDQRPTVAYAPPAAPASFGGSAPAGQFGYGQPAMFGRPASVTQSFQGPVQPYIAPVFNGRSGHVMESSPYGRYVPGELIGTQPVPPAPVPQPPA